MSRPRRVLAALPLGLALFFVAAVWAAGAAWSYDEQRSFADHLGFLLPWLLPLTIDGFAFSLAGVAYAAALDGRAAIQARLMTAVAIGASSASNATWAALRFGDGPNTLDGEALAAVVIAAAVPVASLISFEVLLGELRRAVWRRRGEPAPPAIPVLRPVRLALAPRVAFTEWRAEVLRRTTPTPVAEGGEPSATGQPASPVATSPAPGEAQTTAPEAGGTPPADPPRGRSTNSRPASRKRTATPTGRTREEVAAAYVRSTLDAGGTPSRRGLIDAVRAAGHGIGTDPAEALLQQLTAGPHLEAVK